MKNNNIKINNSSNDTNYEEDFKLDCKGYDIVPTVLPKVNRIIVVGDTHGDLKMAIRSLTMSDVITVVVNEITKENTYVWIGGDTVVVQVGDQIDRCRPYKYNCDDSRATFEDEAHDITIMHFFTNLDKLAKEHGGRVISLLGNHEILNSLGVMTYVSYEGRKQFENYTDPTTNEVIKDGTHGRIHAFKPGNEIAKFMACTRVSSVIVGSNIFVHAAIVPLLMKKYNITSTEGLEKINTLIRKWLLDQIKTKNVAEILHSEKLSPFWPRILGYVPPNALTSENPICSSYLEPVLKTLKVGNMIIGHTPQFYAHNEGINSACDEKLWRVDIGASRAFSFFDKCSSTDDKKPKEDEGESLSFNKLISKERRIQVLEIMNDNIFRVIKNE